MPYQATILRALIASPGDTANERRVLRTTLEDWNSVHGEDGVLLQPLMWERDATPEAGGPQAVINRQLVDKADILIGLFWTRLGTPTTEAESGTVEEIEQMIAAHKPVLLYFSRLPVVPESIDVDEYSRFLEAREKLMKIAFVDHFDSEDELSRKITAALTRTIRSHFNESLRDDVPPRELAGPRAVILARIERFGGNERLAIENHGVSTARDLTIEVIVDEGTPPTIFLPESIGFLPPGGAVDYPMASGFGTAVQWDLIFRYRDETGEVEARQTMA